MPAGRRSDSGHRERFAPGQLPGSPVSLCPRRRSVGGQGASHHPRRKCHIPRAARLGLGHQAASWLAAAWLCWLCLPPSGGHGHGEARGTSSAAPVAHAAACRASRPAIGSLHARRQKDAPCRKCGPLGARNGEAAGAVAGSFLPSVCSVSGVLSLDLCSPSALMRASGELSCGPVGAEEASPQTLVAGATRRLCGSSVSSLCAGSVGRLGYVGSSPSPALGQGVLGEGDRLDDPLALRPFEQHPQDPDDLGDGWRGAVLAIGLPEQRFALQEAAHIGGPERLERLGLAEEAGDDLEGLAVGPHGVLVLPRRPQLLQELRRGVLEGGLAGHIDLLSHRALPRVAGRPAGGTEATGVGHIGASSRPYIKGKTTFFFGGSAVAKKSCKTRRSDGQPCHAPALAGTDYCFWHDPHRRAARRDAARRGGTSATEETWAGDEAALGERLADPVGWGEHYLRDRDGSNRAYWPHQVEDLRCPETRVIHLDGRDVGKTCVLTTDALHYGFTTLGGQGLIAAPHQGHLETIIEEIEFQIDANAELAASIATSSQGRPKIVREPYFRIEFTNGSVLYFRPAGPKGDAFRSLHVERIWVDEGAWLTEQAWRALRQCLKAGGILRIYSTPSGLRDTTYYRLTLSPNWKIFRWPSWLNPSWSAERETELAEFYGGKDTAGWQHEVAGEHGKPSYGAFNVEYLNLCRVESADYQKIVITGEALAGCDSEEETFDRLEMLLNLAPQDGTFWIGGDLGYTNDPTEIVVFKETQEEERRRVKLVLRVHMEHVAYPHIADVIGLLERYYSPMGIGVDRGGNGLAVVQELTTLDKFRPLNLEQKLRGYDFGGAITIAERDGQPLKKRAKEYMTSLINRGFQRRELLLPAEDIEIEDQFTTHTYTLVNGNVIYSKGNDHIVDAVRCAVLVRDQQRLDQIEEIVPTVMPVLTDPIFW